MNNENLKPCKPGETHNPNGRPKGAIGLKKLITQVFNEEITDANGNKKIQGLLMVKAMVEKANKGDVPAFKAICERMEGMPKQDVTVSATVTEMSKITKDGKEVEFDVGDS